MLSIFSVATPFRHQVLYICCIFSGHCSSIKLLRCRIVVDAKLKNCRVLSAERIYSHIYLSDAVRPFFWRILTTNPHCRGSYADPENFTGGTKKNVWSKQIFKCTVQCAFLKKVVIYTKIYNNVVNVCRWTVTNTRPS